MRITVVGGMNLDLLATPFSPLIPRDSTPGRITLRAGGVGRNIAARLAQLGAQVSLITALGCDERADMLTRLCRADGIDISLALPTDLPAPCYLCIHDHRGDMALAVNDMSAMDCLTPASMVPRMAAINAADGCVLDANLPPDTLLFIAQHAAVPLILDPVSCAKAPRVAGVLSRLTAIKPNALEAEALTGERNVERAAQALLDQGVQHVFISMGAEGIYFASRTDRGYLPALPLPNLAATGAGDACCAGITLALLQGQPTRDCAAAGCHAAHDALMHALA